MKHGFLDAPIAPQVGLLSLQGKETQSGTNPISDLHQVHDLLEDHQKSGEAGGKCFAAMYLQMSALKLQLLPPDKSSGAA